MSVTLFGVGRAVAVALLVSFAAAQRVRADDARELAGAILESLRLDSPAGLPIDHDGAGKGAGQEAEAPVAIGRARSFAERNQVDLSAALVSEVALGTLGDELALPRVPDPR